ncbi:hypothetical Protein YC6258_05597 [Gynuella sunshinyii YC6258]|uniref:Uncharacterized protein n=1 Tax=Gynuella sunshinyii YC6258 TaxID=1445510 RepID=A0A0C5W4T9_9GAMM|nr:hypothetical Protein YC6258_05597 [Gynuella sunshinyii YC6258]
MSCWDPEIKKCRPIIVDRAEPRKSVPVMRLRLAWKGQNGLLNKRRGS